MNWLNRFLLANWPWLMDGMLLLMALIIGIQVGESHVHKEWNAEKSKNAQLAAKLEQHVADVMLMQNQINQEISNDFSKKSKLLAERLPDLRRVGLFNCSSGVYQGFAPLIRNRHRNFCSQPLLCTCCHWSCGNHKLRKDHPGCGSDHAHT